MCESKVHTLQKMSIPPSAIYPLPDDGYMHVWNFAREIVMPSGLSATLVRQYDESGYCDFIPLSAFVELCQLDADGSIRNTFDVNWTDDSLVEMVESLPNETLRQNLSQWLSSSQYCPSSSEPVLMKDGQEMARLIADKQLQMNQMFPENVMLELESHGWVLTH